MSGVLTFRGAINNFVLLLRVFEDALGAEHFFVVHTVELHFLGWVGLAELQGAMFEGGCGVGWVRRGGHRQTR